MAGTPEWQIEKCSADGVMVPLMRWCGVRPCELRNSWLGLLSVRTTCFSNRDGSCRGGTIEPITRLHGSSLSGSAAALASVAPAPVAAAPANKTPRPRRARRSNSPLPATCSNGGGDPPRGLLMMVLPSHELDSVRCLLFLTHSKSAPFCRGRQRRPSAAAFERINGEGGAIPYKRNMFLPARVAVEQPAELLARLAGDL